MTDPAPVTAPVAPTIASLIVTPIRGSVDAEGVIMGGAALTIDYELEASAYALLQYETQRRTPKTLRTLEFKFQEQIRDSSIKKFDGKLEVANEAKEYGLEKFSEEVKNGILYYGFQPFFYGPSQADANKMINYVEDRHLVDLATVLQEHTTRLVKPAVVLDPVTNNETQESAKARLKCYDAYEQRDMALTRLYIRSLLTDSFYETVKARHLTMGHDFERIPGQVLFMMVMDACHASIERDFEGARKALSDMTLAQFPGEDVSAFATHAQKKILILMSDFALPIDLGSSLVSKVMQTESAVFNSLVMDHYKKVKAMEKKYAGKNPTLLTADPDYKEYGPLGSMEYLQNEHGMLLGENNWPATAHQLPAMPSGNATGDVDITTSTGTKHGQGTRPVPAYIKCHCCGENHYKRDCTCDKCKAKRPQGGTPQGGGGGRGRGRGRGTQGGRGQSKDRSWRFIEPADKTKPYKDTAGKSWWWCKLCNKGEGAYCLSHDTDGSLSGTKHDQNYKPAKPAGLMAEGAILELQPSWTTTPTVLSPPQAAGLTEVTLQFTGDPSPGAWLCAVDMDPEDDDDLRIIGVVSTPWTPRPHFAICEENADVTPVLTTELPLLEPVTEPQLFYFDCVLIPELFFFDASDDAWFLNRDDDDDMDMYYVAHDDTQGEVLKGHVFYDALTDPFDLEQWMAPTPTLLERMIQLIATTWHEAMMQCGIHLLALSCILWEALDDLSALTDSSTGSRRHRRRKRPTILTFPAGWLVFSALMLLPGGMCPARPHPLYKTCTGWADKSAAYSASYLVYKDIARDLGTTPREVWVFNVMQCRHLVRLLEPLVTTWAPPIADTGVERESYDGNTVDLVRSSEVEYFVDAVGELDPLDEFLETEQFLRDPLDQVSEAVWPDMVDVSGYPDPTFEGGHTFYECLETFDVKDDMWMGDHWITQDVPWQAFRSDWMQQILYPLPFGPSLLSNCEHVIRSADVQTVTFGEPEAHIGPVLLPETISEIVVSDNGYYDLLLSPSALLAGALPTEGAFPIIFDTGATLAVTGIRSDFIESDFKVPPTELRLGGLARGLQIAGIGTVHWSFIADDGSMLTIQTKAYYVPEVNQRLISPQSLFKESNGISGWYRVGEEKSILEFDGKPTLTVHYQAGNRLPIGYGTNDIFDSQEMVQSEINLCVTCEDNQNLTPAKKLLLQWHYRLGHRNIGALQALMRQLPDVFPGPKFAAAAKCELPLPRCAVCEYAKAHRKPTHGKTSSPTPEREGALKVNDLRPGSTVSVDHFESRQEGRTYESYGKSKSQYKGGCIFVDHASGYMHVEHQLGFSATETLRAKHNFEQLALEHGVVVTNYLADNGTFKARRFVDEIRNRSQLIRYCGVNAHHKNGCAERAIRTVTEMSRAMILHASVHWKDKVEPTLWPMAVDYAEYLYNHLPNDKGITPADIFTGTQTPRHKLRDMHVWGCPTYVLDPKLQEGKKLPRWQPRSRQGMFLGLSPKHSSDVPLILNLQTGSISPQYHVVFDDMFSTVVSIGITEDVPKFWQDLLLDSRQQVPMDDEGPDRQIYLDDDWLTIEEIDSKRRQQSRVNTVRTSYMPKPPIVPQWQNVVRTPPVSDNVRENNTSSPSSETTEMTSNRTHSAVPTVISTAPTGMSDSGTALATLPTPLQVPQLTTRTSARANKGTWQTAKYKPETWVAMAYAIPEERLFQQDEHLAYMAALSMDLESGLLDITSPMIYAALKKRKDPDTPDYALAMSGDDKVEYLAAMQKEIAELKAKDTWKVVPRSDAQGKNILPSTWAFKKKRYPDGRARKHKARFCCRGDRQLEGVDYFETYAPTVGWSTIRLLLTLTLANGWETRQVDYTNAFAQADIKEEVFVELPRDFAATEAGEYVLKLNKSLYGLKQAPKTFFDHLRSGLIERGFKQSAVDPCLFMKEEMICVVYVDDTIFAGPDATKLDAMIHSLTNDHDGTKSKYELESEGSVQDFLGINITPVSDKSFRLTQTGLIKKILEKTMMSDARIKTTPASTVALGADADGIPFDEPWEYASVVGMLMYLGTNSRPDIAFSVNQCARHTHNPRDLHAKAVKHICRYLKGTATRGLEFTLNGEMAVDCYVDSDFAGLWNQEDEQDPVSTRSRTGYFLTFGGCPLLWGSRLQTETALSTMEAEYIALSQSMRELIPIREVILEMQKTVFGGRQVLACRSHSKIYEELPMSTVYEDNNACLKFATAPKMSPRTKHIAVKYHFFREKVEKLEIQVIRIDSEDNVADTFTKGLPEVTFQKLRKKIMGW